MWFSVLILSQFLIISASFSVGKKYPSVLTSTSFIQNECAKAKCKLKGINIMECFMSDKCLCGVNIDKKDGIAGFNKDTDFLCTDQMPRVTFYNKADGLFFTTSFSNDNPAQTLTLCETVPLAEDTIDWAGRKEWINTLKNLSHCKDITCKVQSLKFKICNLDETDGKTAQECFDKNVLPSFSVNNETHLLYIDENINCENCLLQVKFTEDVETKSLGCAPIRIMPAKIKSNVEKRSANKLEGDLLSLSQGTAMEVTKKPSHGEILDSSVSTNITPDLKPNIDKETLSNSQGSPSIIAHSPSKLVENVFATPTSSVNSKIDLGLLQQYKNYEFQADEPANPKDSSKMSVSSTLQTLLSKEALSTSLYIEKGLLETGKSTKVIVFNESIGSDNQTESRTTIQDAKTGQNQTTQTTKSSYYSTPPMSILRTNSDILNKALTNQPETTSSVIDKKTTLNHFSSKTKLNSFTRISTTVANIRFDSQQEKEITKPNRHVSLNITRKTAVGSEANFKFHGLNEDLHRNNPFRPMALTRHEKTEQLLSVTDPVQKAPLVRNTTLSFEDMWNKRMQALEDSPQNNFQAREDDPPAKEDPYIKIPEHEETFESTGQASSMKNLFFPCIMFSFMILIFNTE